MRAKGRKSGRRRRTRSEYRTLSPSVADFLILDQRFINMSEAKLAADRYKAVSGSENVEIQVNGLATHPQP